MAAPGRPFFRIVVRADERRFLETLAALLADVGSATSDAAGVLRGSIGKERATILAAIFCGPADLFI